MSSDLDDLLDMVDEWKFKLYEKLKGMTREQQLAHFADVHRRALERRKRRRSPQKKKATAKKS
jgi:hypothetical protein